MRDKGLGGGDSAKGKHNLGPESGARPQAEEQGQDGGTPRQRGQDWHGTGPCVALLLAKTIGLLLPLARDSPPN